MFDSPGIKNLLAELKSLKDEDRITIHDLACAIARSSGKTGAQYGLEVMGIERDILTKRPSDGIVLLNPETQIPYNGNEMYELAGDWLVTPAMAVTILEDLYQQRGQREMPLRQNPVSTMGPPPVIVLYKPYAATACIEPITRMAVAKMFHEIAWRGLWDRENANGLSKCRVSPPGEDPLYDPEKVARWVGNQRPELSTAQALERVKGILPLSSAPEVKAQDEPPMVENVQQVIQNWPPKK